MTAMFDFLSWAAACAGGGVESQGTATQPHMTHAVQIAALLWGRVAITRAATVWLLSCIFAVNGRG